MAEAASIRILSVEDHPVVRAGLHTIVSSQSDMVMVAQAANAEQAVAEFRRRRPDITLMDLRLAGHEWHGHVDRHSRRVPRGPHHHAEHVRGRPGDSARAARGRRGLPAQEHAERADPVVIRAVHAGRTVPTEVAARLAEHLDEHDLTPRELEVLRLIRDGFRNKQIADTLAIAETTVTFHVKNLVEKLGANDRAHAVVIAIRRGFLDVDV